MSLKKILKEFLKKLMTFNTIQWIIATLMFLSIYLVYFTSRKVIHGKHVFKAHRKKKVIFVLWHGRSMMLSPIVRAAGLSGYAISSRHKDGRLMAKLQRLFRLRPIYGSTNRDGAVTALRQGVRVLNNNKLLGLSPDGPKGPRMRLNDGVLYFAKMTGAPIVSVCYSCNKPWFQKRWDRYLVCLPFSKIICDVAEPIYITSKDFEAERDRLENLMIKQLQDLDAKFGLPKIEPEDRLQ